MTKCLWHECGKDFAPTHHLQLFCGKSCRQDRALWKQRRGSVLVDLLLENNLPALEAERAKLLKETRHE